MGKLICSECGKVLDADYPVEGVSHGLCEEHAAELVELARRQREERERRRGK